MTDLLTDVAAIEKLCESIKKRGAKLDNDIGIAAMSAIAHHAAHGDVTIINRVVDSMPRGSRVNALREFILTFGKVKYDDKAKTFLHDREGSADLEGMREAHWTDFKPEAPYVPFDAAKAIAKMLKRVETADPAKGDKVTPTQAQAIAKLAAEFGAA